MEWIVRKCNYLIGFIFSQNYRRRHMTLEKVGIEILNCLIWLKKLMERILLYAGMNMLTHLLLPGYVLYVVYGGKKNYPNTLIEFEERFFNRRIL